ncbi:hypothetical protein [Microbacterium halophytorum]|uniref:hypothetical protein n=1 Tax=Microbacterium halophytorum TaxID=2067568 RepID=UPI001319D1DB|nr:hypothetical protein [Microbacterium halophytorum]
MESTGDTATLANRRLQELARLERSASERAPSRAYWWLMLWSAILISVYVAVFLATFGDSTTEDVSERSGGYSATWVMMTPVIAFSALHSGARERFRIRTRPSTLYWCLYGLAAAGFIAAGVLDIAGIAYPRWLNMLVPVVLLLTMAASPVRHLVTSSPRSPASWGDSPLSGAARLMTVLLGAAIGLLLASSAITLAAAVSGAIAMVFLIVVLASWRSSYGLPRAGYQWHLIHWVSFGTSSAIVFVCVLLTTFTTWFGTGHNAAAGALVFLVMGVAAFLPRRSDQRER